MQRHAPPASEEHRLPASPAHRYKFCLAPVNVRDPRQAAALLHFAVKYAKGLPVTLDIHIPTSPALTAEGLRELEAIHQV